MTSTANRDLTPGTVPPSDADWSAISAFALTFDGYEECGGFEECAEIANSGKAETLSELRATLFFLQRSFRHTGYTPEGPDLERLRSLVGRIRAMVQSGRMT